MARILVVDDDREIVNLLDIYLRNERYEVVKAYNGQEAIDALLENPDFDIILLDLMMPVVDGNEVLEFVKERYNEIPVIILSAKSSDTDRISGLIAGADDYVTKPFNPLEVVARIKSILRRQKQNETKETKEENEGIIEIGSLIINQGSHEVKTIDGVDIQLTALEFGILYLLASNPGKVFSAEEIFENVWDEEVGTNAKTVMVHVSHLRDKIAKATGGDKVVETVWGVGYKIDG